MELSDYAQALGAAQQLVPSYDQLRSNALAIQGQQLQNRAAQQEIVARDQAFEQQQRLTADIGALGSAATPEAYRNFALRYPQLSKPLLDAAGSMETKQREQVVRESAQIRATIAAGKPEIGAQLVQRHIDADIAAGKQPDPDDQAMLDMLKSGDPTKLKAASGLLYATLASFDPDSAAKNVGEYASPTDDKRYVVGRALVDQQGNALYRDPEPAREVPVYDTEGNRVGTQFVNAAGGGDPVSSGAAGGRGDTSRLINTDAGGGYVPASVQTLGQFVNFGRSMNRNGAKSSSAGVYQINGSTMADFAPRALGEGWQNAPFNAETQDRVGREIFNWAKRQPNPAAALRGRWVSLTPAESARLVQGGWEQARGLIARKESGGGPGASAGPATGSSGVIGPVPSQAAKSAPSGYRYLADGVTLEPIPGGPADKGRSGGGKALPDSIVKRLEPKIEGRDQLTTALASFKDDYAGHSVLGDVSNTIQGVTGLGAEGQRDWWAQFRSTDNVIRNQLFGASLTDGEKQAYNATTITPRMAPSEIRRNLQSRVQIVNKALARQRNVLTKNGFSQEALGALFDPLGSQGSSPAAPSGFRILRVRPK